MSTELKRSEDCYGMTAEERVEFERAFPLHDHLRDSGHYTYIETRCAYEGWAACAKLKREQIEQQAATIKELEFFLKNARYELDALPGLEAENERLRADAGMLDWIDKTACGLDHLGYGDYRYYTGPGWWDPVRVSIAKAMKGGE